MLYFVLPESECPGLSADNRIRVVRFGSKSLKKYQRSYGPTKLELLGMVHAILDCAPYLRGRHFTLQCDHQCLKPLFQKQFRGAIYERWLTILQQFDFEIVYKPAVEMSVPDALSRCAPQNQPEHEKDSPSEHDPHFPYVHEKPSVINLPTGQTLSDVLNVSDSDVNNVIPNGQLDFSVNPTPNIISVVDVSSAQIHSIDSSSQFCTPNPFSVLLIDDYDADTETEASDNGHRNGTRPQSVNAVTAVSVTNKKKRKTKRMGKQASRPNDVPIQSAIPSTSRSVIDASGSNLSKSCHSNVCSDNLNNLPPSDDEETECYCDCLDTLPSNQTDSSDRTDDNVDDPSVMLETRTKRLTESLNVFNSSCFSLATVSTLQRKDPDLSPIITYLENSTLPSSQKLSRQIVFKQPHYSPIDGVLFHSWEPKTKRKFVSHDYTLVLPKVLQKPVIDMYHSSPLAAHAGITATLQRVKADFLL
ncbi:retrovirus-related pol polyprotein from transposon [Plakobranchus ocellatus]|uniref:Retrovirus-related pol polyprotein from transposon n=1 Tax=Plakobranchus ocellatus TaxID=259542 RepID=A0AAV4CE22_9GAST|nr:retrovirus-related pol polyprotein from transposon [Plakobranchus ocellatus]